MHIVEYSAGFERLTPPAARTILRIWALVTLLFILISVSPLASGFADKPSRGAGDVELYQAEVRRIAAGATYHDAAAAELHARGYPTLSMFNWRTPLPMWLLGQMPEEAGRSIIGLLGALGLFLAVSVLSREANSRVALAGGILLAGALLPCWLDQVYIMPEVWAGLLILISICCYGLRQPVCAVVCGLAALFVRELAAPYAIICLLLALRERRHWETLAWRLGSRVMRLSTVGMSRNRWPWSARATTRKPKVGLSAAVRRSSYRSRK